MTHDPLCVLSEPCPVSNDESHRLRRPLLLDVCDWCDCTCECRLIARVREDERGKHSACRCNELEAMVKVDGKYESIAIDGQVLERPEVTRAAALRDAVEAVKAETTVHPAARQRVVAAIEALGGER